MNDIDISRFLKDGKVIIWPAKHVIRKAILEYLISHFEINKFYTEKEVNDLLGNLHTLNDPLFLRRELVDTGLLNREKDGSKYWRTISE